MGLLDELTLLNFQANLYNTKFVSTKKLASARIPDSLLKLVTHKLAVKLCVFPVKFDSQAQELSIISVQPDDLDVLKSVQFATRVPKVRALVARPAAIQAAIRAHFENDAQAFGQVRNAAADRDLAVEHDAQAHADLRRCRTPQPMLARDANFSTAAGAQPRETGSACRRCPRRRPCRCRCVRPSTRRCAASRRRCRRHRAAARRSRLPVRAGPRPALPPLLARGRAARFSAAQPRSSRRSRSPPGVPLHDYLETLNVLVALLENERGELRNHSVQVARICRRLCERLGLKQEESDAIIIAAYLHDVGKSSAFHLTALNVAEYDAYKRAGAQELPDAGAHLRVGAAAGRGAADPRRSCTSASTARASPIAARPRTSASARACSRSSRPTPTSSATPATRSARSSSSQEAWDVLAKYKSKIFDPGLVDVFKLVVLGDDLRAKLLADSRRALLVDPDAEETTVLELRLGEHGFEVTIARNSVDAENELAGEFDVVISEVDIKPLNGFELLQNIRASGNEVPFMFHSKNAEGDAVQRGFDLGADDFITKPTSPDLVALKVTRVLDGAGRVKRKSGGVSGSLTEMALPDVVQILFHGRKSGKLSVSADGTPRRDPVLATA